MKLKDYLRGLLTDEELKLVPSSYDIIGSRQKAVVIIELPENLGDKRLLVAKALMKIHKNVKSVLVKKSARKGIYRLRELEVILGEKDTEVIHVEYGYRLKLDPTKVYFSPRESTERQRIARQVREGEVVMVMFAGVGPYAFAILRAQPLVKKII
ncbi:MAG TPA: hypothetical protein ENF87_03380, partial [Thermoproteales archaeon]|nr:hypothetical protein [Thermoproteales archaeon]